MTPQSLRGRDRGNETLRTLEKRSWNLCRCDTGDETMETKEVGSRNLREETMHRRIRRGNEIKISQYGSHKTHKPKWWRLKRQDRDSRYEITETQLKI